MFTSADKNLSSIEVVSSEDARWLALHGYATIIGTGQVTDNDSKVTEVVLVRALESQEG